MNNTVLFKPFSMPDKLFINHFPLVDKSTQLCRKNAHIAQIAPKKNTLCI